MAERSSGARQSDEEILASLDAAPDAVVVFYRRHACDLLSYLERRTQDPALSADLCAETFAAMLRSAHRFDPRAGSAAARLYTVADGLLEHCARRGAAPDRARRRLGLALLAAGETFVADLQEELVAAARFRAGRRARRPALPRPPRCAAPSRSRSSSSSPRSCCAAVTTTRRPASEAPPRRRRRP